MSVLFLDALNFLCNIPVGNTRVSLSGVFTLRSLDVVRQLGLEGTILALEDDADH